MTGLTSRSAPLAKSVHTYPSRPSIRWAKPVAPTDIS
ncbi:hypothetical protein HNQ79_003607 [Streptomyces candidus]|uniref:Uncharacterized protein n=1 Tax=Streptomyces candidus TaxID=67283 RepID=A0A7X0HGB9_9ACTN|nr:hypothetical protein [Streptomyces candidus]